MVLARLPLLSLVSVYSLALVGLGEAPLVPSPLCIPVSIGWDWQN